MAKIDKIKLIFEYMDYDPSALKIKDFAKYSSLDKSYDMIMPVIEKLKSEDIYTEIRYTKKCCKCTIIDDNRLIFITKKDEKMVKAIFNAISSYLQNRDTL